MQKPSPSPTPVPSLRSRHPRSASAQAQLHSANGWLAATTLTASTCPTSAVTKTVTNDTGVGKLALSKYDPAKFESMHKSQSTIERNDMVKDLREDVELRVERTRKYREVMAMAASQQVAWEKLRVACEQAVENSDELEERLMWCEEDFEAGELTAVVAAGEQVLDGGAESTSQQEERGRPRTRE